VREAERIWREKSDEDLLDAAAELEQFTAEGQAIIREELKRRGLEDPVEQAGNPANSEESGEGELECLRCRAPLRAIEPSALESPFQLPIAARPCLLHVYACPQCGHVELFVDVT